MKESDINDLLIRIVSHYEMIKNESSDNPEFHDFIAINSIAIKMIAHNIHTYFSKEFANNKAKKLQYQKLCHALCNIEKQLNHKLKIVKDKKYMELVLSNLGKIQEDISVVEKYVN